ncbi:UNKNOWN [Stylonychia lemnae]|uniref:Uncharacterized protein n=1 Tax=Stylonychia lemnae TaxID=5949 RepID=A0A078A6M0_STYLE|nr:UNKNOWN [Stylonychia lemnae]|eukprot:CDW77854.1 UNKNOWN [Stylonychia lemnae]
MPTGPSIDNHLNHSFMDKRASLDSAALKLRDSANFNRKPLTSAALSPIKKFSQEISFHNDYSAIDQEHLRSKIATMNPINHVRTMISRKLNSQGKNTPKKQPATAASSVQTGRQQIQSDYMMENSTQMPSKMLSTFKISTISTNKHNKSLSKTNHNSSIMTTDGQSFDLTKYEKTSEKSKRQSMNFHRNSVASSQDKSAYQELLAKVADSHMNLRKVKNGQPIFPSTFLSEKQNIPFLKNKDLSENVKKYLDSGQIYIPASLQPQSEDLRLPDRIEIAKKTFSVKPDFKRQFTINRERQSINSTVGNATTDTGGITSKYNNRQLRAKTQLSSIIEYSESYQIKDMNKLEPVAITERKFDRSLEAKLKFPKNPTFQLDDNARFNSKKRKKMMPLVEFCQQKNISFTENESRYYELQKNKQNFKHWIHTWRRYCNQNILDRSNLQTPKDIFQSQISQAQDEHTKYDNHLKLKSPSNHLQHNHSYHHNNEQSTNQLHRSPEKAYSNQRNTPIHHNSSTNGANSNKYRLNSSLHKIDHKGSKLDVIQIRKDIFEKTVQDHRRMQNLRMKKKLEKLLELPVQLSGKQEKNGKKKYKKDQNYYDKIDLKRKKINDKLLKILERVDLDRPILLKEKFDVLWNFDEIFAEKDIIQRKIEKKKVERSRINKQMAEKYNIMLSFISKRFTSHKGHNHRGQIEETLKPLESERKFLDFLRIIIEGGWIVSNNEEWVDIIEFLGIENELETSKQCTDFMTEVSKLFGFEQDLKLNFKLYDPTTSISFDRRFE